jgi:tetratricopeptide (TPR) repeat protein
MAFLSRIKTAHALGVILAVAFGIRLIYLYQISDSPLLEVLLIDSHYYDQTGLKVALGQGTEERVFFMNPYYTYYLALIYTLFGHSWVAALFVQAVMGTVSCALIYGIGRLLVSSDVGLIGAALAALYGTFVFYDGALLTANPIVFYNLIGLYCLLLWKDKQKLVYLIASGIALGFSTTGRGLILMFVVLLPLWFYLQNQHYRTVLTNWVYVLIGVFCILVPVGLRNWSIGGEFAMTPSGTSQNFYIGNHPGATGIYKNADFLTSAEPQHEFGDYYREAQKRAGKTLTHDEAATFWISEGFRYIFSNPKDYIKLQIQKTYLFWNRTEAPNNLSYYFAHDFAPILHFLIIGWGIIAPLGIVGLFLLARTRPPYLLYFYLGAYLSACFIFFVTAEYRLPIAPVLMLGAAYLISIWYTQWKAGNKTHIIKPAIVALLLAIPINYQTTFAQNLTRKRIDYFNFGNLYSRADNLQKAEYMYRKTLAIDPAFSAAHRALAELYQKQGNIQAMVTENRQVQLLEGGLNASADPLQIALEAFSNHQYETALEHFQTIIQNGTARPEHLNNIGLCHYRLDQFQQAEQAYQKALEQQPNYARAHFNLALLDMKTNRLSEAELALKQTLSLEPNNHKARYRLAELYIQTNQPQEALNLWQMMLQTFPNDLTLKSKVDSLQQHLTNP